MWRHDSDHLLDHAFEVNNFDHRIQLLLVDLQVVQNVVHLQVEQLRSCVYVLDNLFLATLAEFLQVRCEMDNHPERCYELVRDRRLSELDLRVCLFEAHKLFEVRNVDECQHVARFRVKNQVLNLNFQDPAVAICCLGLRLRIRLLPENLYRYFLSIFLLLQNFVNLKKV